MAKAATAEKNSTFVYEGTDNRGAKVKGEVASKNPAAAKAELRKQGIKANKVRNKTEFSIGGKQKITTQDVTIFLRQMATRMKAGVPLVQSFSIVADGLDNASMRDVVNGIKNDVEGGNNFAGSLRKHPLQFEELVCSLVEAGEASGALETMLDRIAIYKEKSEALKQKIKKALNGITQSAAAQ